MVVRIHQPCQLELFQVAHAGNPLGLCLGFAERGKEHACQDRNDRNHHQEFDQGKSLLFHEIIQGAVDF